MTVLLVLITFVALVIADYVYSSKHVRLPLEVETAARASGVRPASVVSGFEVPAHLSFHPGHAWALRESANLVRVGLDDFAARLVGKIDRIALPRRGQWIRQGQRIWTIERDGRRADMVSPIEGIVTDINEAVVLDPERARLDPYREGWLVKVESPDAGTNFRNLLGGDVARRWMEEAASRLRGRTPVLAGAVAQDGGVAVNDLTSALPGESWNALTGEFFLA
jgi:glycine cleavage system H lipoate-binding protein